MPQADWCTHINRDALAHVIDGLPDHLRYVARMRFQMRWSRQAIAVSVNLPLTTIVGRLWQARDAINRAVAKDPRVSSDHAQLPAPAHLVRRAWLDYAGLT